MNLEHFYETLMETANVDPVSAAEISYVEPDIFWGEIAPSEHVLNLYERYDDFIDHLASFVTNGLRLGESVVLIALPDRLDAIQDRLASKGLDLKAFIQSGQYIILDAQATLNLFMVNGWPNDELFKKTILAILAQARKPGQRLRAFGEMVALLWANGHTAATVRLEHLWHDLCKREKFTLFCAYPRAGFTRTPMEAIKEMEAIQKIYDAHSKVLPSKSSFTVSS